MAGMTSNMTTKPKATPESIDATLKLLKSVVEVQDAVEGTVRLKRQVADIDEMSLDTRSTKTVRVRRAVP